MKITVVGGGNIGTLMAGELAYRGHEVTVYTSRPSMWSTEISILDGDNRLLMTGNLKNITSDLREAVVGAELIWITLPAQMFMEFGAEVSQYIVPGQMVGIVPGSGGAEFAFHQVVEKGGILFGLQRVHSIARLENYGKSVHMLGRKSKLELGTIPADKSEEISSLVEGLFDMPCTALPNYLCVTLTPSNPILHTTRLYSMFKDYRPGVVYPRNFLFYEEWTVESSEMLLACDKELQNLCDMIPLELKDVVSLLQYYESPTAETMTEKIKSIKAFRGLSSPMVPCEGGWIPDMESRYFTTDFPYGLKIIKDFAVIYGVETPNIDIVWEWYTQFDTVHSQMAVDLMEYDREYLESLYR